MDILRCITDIQDKLQLILIKWAFLWSINPIQIGGGGICPHALWMFKKVLINMLKLSNLVTFCKIIWKQFGISKYLFIKFDVTMATTY